MLNAHVRDNLNALGSIPVTSLPGGPSDGDICVLTDSLTVPTLQWPLRYNATATKWQAYGGGWGYGTSLPTPTGLDRVPFTLVDSVTNPTYQWELRYHAGSSNTDKWEFVGGAPLISYGVNASLSASYVATCSLTIPRSGVYSVSVHGTSVNTNCTEKYRENGAVIETFDNSGSSGGETRSSNYVHNSTLTSGWVIDLGIQSNGTDAGKQYGTLSVVPVRLS